MQESIKPQISAVELTRTLGDAGFLNSTISNCSTSKDIVINGMVKFNSLESGINVHCTDAEEKLSGKNTAQIEEGISINYLFKGKLSFAIDGRKYTIDATSEPKIFILLINEKSIFTRFFELGHHIKKLNLFVQKSWLIQRSQTDEDKRSLSTLFGVNHQVYQWECKDIEHQLSTELFKYNENQGLSAYLKSENIAFELFSLCYQKLQLSKITKHELKAINLNSPLELKKRTDSYENKIKHLLHETLSLDQIAEKLGASVSTLQRYFKSHHQMTIKEYIRNQKLESARRAIIFNNKSIGEVAYDAGYNHVSNFVTAFKRLFNVSPAQLKKQHLKF